MLVNDWMNSPVITIDVTESMQKAVNLLQENKIGMLPVVENGRLVGIVTDRDLREASPSRIARFEIKNILYQLAHVKIAEIMTPDPVTVRPDFTIEETAHLLRQNNISGCPVLDHEDQIVGVITRNDLLNAMIETSSIPQKGIQFGFMIEDKPGSIKEVTDVFRDYNARLVSILTTYEKVPHGFRYLYVRVFGVNRERLDALKRDASRKAKMLYMIDLKEGTRDTYASY